MTRDSNRAYRGIGGPLGSYWKSTAHNNITQGVVLRNSSRWSRNSVEQVSGERQCARGRTILFLRKQYCHTYRIQERELSFKEGQFFLYWSSAWLLVRNVFWEIPLDWRRFLSREPVFMMMWACPLPRHNRHKERVRIGTVCIWEQILWENSRHLLSMDKQREQLGKKERESIFSFLFSVIARLS